MTRWVHRHLPRCFASRRRKSATRSSAGPSYGLPGQPATPRRASHQVDQFHSAFWTNFAPPLTKAGSFAWPDATGGHRESLGILRRMELIGGTPCKRQVVGSSPTSGTTPSADVSRRPRSASSGRCATAAPALQSSDQGARGGPATFFENPVIMQSTVAEDAAKKTQDSGCHSSSLHSPDDHRSRRIYPISSPTIR